MKNSIRLLTWVDIVFVSKVEVTCQIVPGGPECYKEPAFNCICDAEAHLTLFDQGGCGYNNNFLRESGPDAGNTPTQCSLP